jgi:hypothetical protein
MCLLACFAGGFAFAPVVFVPCIGAMPDGPFDVDRYGLARDGVDTSDQVTLQ